MAAYSRVIVSRDFELGIHLHRLFATKDIAKSAVKPPPAFARRRQPVRKSPTGASLLIRFAGLDPIIMRFHLPAERCGSGSFMLTCMVH